MIAPQSLHWILTPFLISLTLLIFSLFWVFFAVLALFFFLVFLVFLFFFRDPEITLGQGIISPADGKLVSCESCEDPDIGLCTKISIFMNIWNIHVNRAPVDGTLVTVRRHAGKHAAAFKDISDNESVALIFNTQYGHIKVVQVTGAFARRIVCYIRTGDTVGKGERVGIVRFGSRVEMYLPQTIEILPRVGQKIFVGETLGIPPAYGP